MDSRARQLLLMQAIQQRQQPNMAQRLTGLGLYNMEPQAPQAVFNEWQSQPPGDESSSIADLLGQIEASRRYMVGPAGDKEAEQIHTERNHSMNNLGVRSPWQQGLWL